MAEAMARKLGVTKADILDPTSENLAVRLALAETNIITETKEYLEEVISKVNLKTLYHLYLHE